MCNFLLPVGILQKSIFFLRILISIFSHQIEQTSWLKIKNNYWNKNSGT